MPRQKFDGLPKRVYFKHGAYWYVSSKDGKQKWTSLGPQKEHAIETANELNAIRDPATRRGDVLALTTRFASPCLSGTSIGAVTAARKSNLRSITSSPSNVAAAAGSLTSSPHAEAATRKNRT
jgi:hypothetical protein